MTILAVAQDAAQGADLDLQIQFLDEGLRPGSGNQLFLPDHVARALDQSGEDVKSATAEKHRLVALKQKPLRSNEPERAKRDRISVHGQSAGFGSFYPILLDWRQSEPPRPAQGRSLAVVRMPGSERRAAQSAWLITRAYNRYVDFTAS